MKKLSIRSSEFTDPIADALNQGKHLVVWHQIPWSGGNQEWFLLRCFAALEEVLNRGQVASAFTVYEWQQLPLPRLADEVWLTRSSEALARETENMMLLLGSARSDNDLLELTWVGEEDDLKEWLEEDLHSEVIVGRIPNLWTGEIVRGYFPDAQGVIQSGPY